MLLATSNFITVCFYYILWFSPSAGLAPTNTIKMGNFSKYILIDQTALTALDISDATIDHISGLLSDVSSINPDSVVAMVAYVSYGANIDLIKRMSQMRKLFINPNCWESLQFKTRPQAVTWIKKKVHEKFGIDDLSFD